MITTQRNTTTPTPSAQAVQANVSSGASFQWENTMYNFGNINQGEVVNYTFKFTNNGTEDLLIQSASASCGCTVPTWPKEPILPGEKSVIKVKYDTKRLGAINKSVTITSNATEATKVIRIKGNIIAPKTTPVKETTTGAPVAN